jgi:hypothetical protein
LKSTLSLVFRFANEKKMEFSKKLFAIFFLFSFSSKVCCQNVIKKCCPKNELLNIETLTCHVATIDFVSNVTVLPSHMIDLSIEDFSSSLKKTSLTEDDLKVGFGWKMFGYF